MYSARFALLLYAGWKTVRNILNHIFSSTKNMSNIHRIHAKIRTVIFLLCLLSSSTAKADVYSIDSINKLYVTNAPLSHIRIDSLQRRCEANGYKECKRSRLENIYSLILLYEHEPALAVLHANRAYMLATKDKDFGNQLVALQTLIENELNLGFNKLAVNHIHLMKNIGEKSSKQYRDYYIPTALKYLAMSYSKSEEMDKSIELLDKAIRLSSTSIDKYILFYEISFQKAKCYINVADYRNAEKTFLNILHHLQSDSKYKRGGIDKAGYAINYLETYSQLALIDVYLGKYQEASKIFGEVNKLYVKYPGVPEVKNRMAKYLLLTHQYDRLNTFVEPLINTDIKSKEMLELMQVLQQSYLLQGDVVKAKNLYAEYITLDDSIKKRTSGCALEEMNIAYNTYNLQKELDIQKIYLVSAVIILLLFTFIIVVVVIYNRRLKLLYKSARERIDEFMERQEKIDITTEKDLHNIAGENLKEVFRQLDEKIKSEKPYLNSMFGRDELASFAKLDKNKLTEIVKLGAKVTPNKYLNQLRIVCSVELLKSKPEYAIESIATDSGFSNRTTFYRVFTDTFGITPMQYRKGLRSKQPAAMQQDAKDEK